MSVAADFDRAPSSRGLAHERFPLSPEQALSLVSDLLLAPSDTGAWWTSVARRIDDLTEAMWEERAQVDGPGGLHQEIVREQPRFAFQVRGLEREHAQLIDDLAQMRLLVGACMGRASGVSVVVAAATDLVGRVRVHRRRASTLVHEAYQRDLGGGD